MILGVCHGPFGINQWYNQKDAKKTSGNSMSVSSDYLSSDLGWIKVIAYIGSLIMLGHFSM